VQKEALEDIQSGIDMMAQAVARLRVAWAMDTEAEEINGRPSRSRTGVPSTRRVTGRVRGSYKQHNYGHFSKTPTQKADARKTMKSLKVWRLAQNLTQAEAVRKINVTKPDGHKLTITAGAYANWECGRNMPCLEHVAHMKHFMKVKGIKIPA
jgi:hypothetical protein